jgi:ribonuclease J
LENIFSTAPGRMIVACFASNIHRIQQFFHTASVLQKKVAICGLSIQKNIDLAQELGYIEIPEGILVSLNEVLRLPPEKVVIVTTGSQGEPMSALARIANGQHRHIKISKTDTVLISASIIPGNERTVSRIVNTLFKQQVKVFYQGISDTHTSGHSSKEELKFMLNIVKPKYFMPIHGEYRHLTVHASLAEQMGIKSENIFIMENGEVLELNKINARISGKVQAGEIFVDGKGEGDISEIVIRDRQILARDGIIIVNLIINKNNQELLTEPQIISRGFMYMKLAGGFFNELKDIVLNCLQNYPGMEWENLQNKIKDKLKSHIEKRIERNPIILVSATFL